MTTTPGSDPRPATTTPISRRGLLLGAGGLVVLAACGKSGSDTTATSAAGAGTSAGLAALNLQARFDPNQYAVPGREQRLVVSLLDKTGVTPKDAPRSVEFQLLKNGAPVGAPTKVDAHDDGVPVPYYPVRVTPDAPGQYALSAALPGSPSPVNFVVTAADQLPLVQPGQKVPVADTPTTTDARGVDPICTRPAGRCPLHEVNLRDALAAAKPTVLLVSTPQFCQIGVCGPVLDLVLEPRAERPDLTFIHAEVYKRPNEGSGDPSAAGLAPVVDALGLTYEPALYLIGANGTVQDRLDYVFDRREINAAIAALR